MKTFKTTKEEFMKQNYVTCNNCGYNNERSRFLQYGKCLRCDTILDDKTYFMIQMMKKLKNNKRKRS
jgi:predicted Zn-ribbon and HTH transcriptional regulator